MADLTRGEMVDRLSNAAGIIHGLALEPGKNGAYCRTLADDLRAVRAHLEPVTVDTVHADPHGTYIRIFELVCRGPRHEARRLFRALDEDERAAITDRLRVTLDIIREEA